MEHQIILSLSMLPLNYHLLSHDLIFTVHVGISANVKPRIEVKIQALFYTLGEHPSMKEPHCSYVTP